ncbi:MAG: hypothetical protein QM765_20320 [Myxococcales bacterium]
MARWVARLSRLGLACAVWLYAALAFAEDLPGTRGEQYQGKSLERFGRGSEGIGSTIKQIFEDLDITKAKALIIVGAVGALYTFNKNKRLFHWGVAAAISYALIAAGALAIYKGWLN